MGILIQPWEWLLIIAVVVALVIFANTKKNSK